MPPPHRRWGGGRGEPRGSGLPGPERARDQEHADKAEHGEKTLKLWLGETRVPWRPLNCLQSHAKRSMEGRWRQRRTARWTRRIDKRTAGATSAGSAPPHEGGAGMRGPPSSRSRVASVNCGMAYGTRVLGSQSGRSRPRLGPSHMAKGHRWRTIAGEGGGYPVSCSGASCPLASRVTRKRFRTVRWGAGGKGVSATSPAAYPICAPASGSR
jgi:hypothetical protein